MSMGNRSKGFTYHFEVEERAEEFTVRQRGNCKNEGRCSWELVYIQVGYESASMKWMREQEEFTVRQRSNCKNEARSSWELVYMGMSQQVGNG